MTTVRRITFLVHDDNGIEPTVEIRTDGKGNIRDNARGADGWCEEVMPIRCPPGPICSSVSMAIGQCVGMMALKIDGEIKHTGGAR